MDEPAQQVRDSRFARLILAAILVGIASPIGGFVIGAIPGMFLYRIQMDSGFLALGDSALMLWVILGMWIGTVMIRLAMREFRPARGSVRVWCSVLALVPTIVVWSVVAMDGVEARFRMTGVLVGAILGVLPAVVLWAKSGRGRVS